MGDWSLYVEAGNTQTQCYLDGFSKTFSVIFDYRKLKMRISVTSKKKNLEFMGLLFKGVVINKTKLRCAVTWLP
jgi:hypothetical protein